MSQDDQQRIVYYTNLCETLYGASSHQDRERAEHILEHAFPTFADAAGSGVAGRRPSLDSSYTYDISSPQDSAYALTLLLKNSPNPYVQMFASTRLKALITDQFPVFSQDAKIQTRNFVLEYLYLHPNLQPFVIVQLAQVFTMLTKLGWFDLDEFKTVHRDLNQFLQASIDHRIVGLQLLTILVQDINLPIPARNLARHRKTAVAFRDDQLFLIFESANNILQELLQNAMSLDNDQQDRLCDAVLKLISKCMAFDFIGTTPDESGEDSGTIQIPTSWKSLIEDESFIHNMFSAYNTFPTPHSSQAMECLAQIATIRRSIYSEEERHKVILRIMQGTRDILVSSAGLSEESNHHHFCRMLARFRATYQLNEITEKDLYEEWITLVADFTIKAFQAWQYAPNSVTYLLSFWSKIIQSLSYTRTSTALGKIEALTIELTRSFISSRIDSVELTLEEMLDDPLDNEDALMENLDMLANIARCKYQESASTVISIFEPIAANFEDLVSRINSGGAHTEELKQAILVTQTKFAWLVYIIGSFLSARTTYLSSDELDEIDGLLTTKVVQLINVNELLQSQHGGILAHQKLDCAFVYFLQQFKKAYIGEPSSRVAVYTNLNKTFGIGDQVGMLDLVTQKIVSILQFWTTDNRVVWHALKLFHDLSSGYSSAKHMRKLDSVRMIMLNHSSDQFAFLKGPGGKANRALYYNALAKILFAEDCSIKQYLDFMKPFQIQLENLLSLNSVGDFQQESVKTAAQGLFKDLQGFIAPIQNRANFMLFFEWFYPDYTQVVLKGLEAWGADVLSTTLLKFYSEFVINRSQRLTFDRSSADGILIFRETSKVLMTYAQSIVKMAIQDPSQKYTYKYKGVATCFEIMTRSNSGKYVPFDVFALYQDKALENALNAVFQMTLDTPLDDMMAFPKLTKAFFGFMDVFTDKQMMQLPTMEADVFLYMMRAVGSGVKSLDPGVCTQACATIDHICTFVVQQSEMQISKRPKNHWLVLYLSQYTDILPYLFTTVFNVVLFEDKPVQWSLSRPLLGLMLLHKDYMMEYVSNVINHQLPERREFLSMSIQSLMNGVEWNLMPRNRERFSQNLSAFRRELNSNSISLVPIAADYGVDAMF
ncbi:armadillo-type protein [Umbelopsis sp. AD052]|nr:armadillo-type protein [Umbelopsis sp. AD052]